MMSRKANIELHHQLYNEPSLLHKLDRVRIMSTSNYSNSEHAAVFHLQTPPTTTYHNISDIWTNATSVHIARETPQFPKYIQVTATVFYSFIFLIGVFGNVLVVTVVCARRNMKTSMNLHLVNLCVADLLVMVVCMPTALVDVFAQDVWYFGDAMCVFGNVLVVTVVCARRNMKTSMNIHLVNLCVADLLVMVVCMPTALVDVFAQDVWYFGDAMCKAVPFLENTVAHASVLTLIAISVERYRVVCRPLSGIRDNAIKSARVVPGVWLIAAVSSIPYLYIARYKDSRHIDGTPIKVCRMPVVRVWHKVYVSMLFSYYFVIPFALMLFLYCRICYKLQVATEENSHATPYQNPSHYRRRKRLKLQVINIIFCLVLLFFIFHLPFRVISMWLTFAKTETIHGLGLEKYFNILYSGRIMFYMNHAVNPIIYNFVSTKFRNALMSLLTGRRGRGSFMSSNRRGNSPFTRPRNSQAFLFEVEPENGKRGRTLVRVGSTTTSSQRQRRNEFYPMYAHLIQKHGTSVQNGIADNSL